MGVENVLKRYHVDDEVILLEEELDLFTKIFLDSDDEKTFVIERVRSILEGNVNGSNIVTKQADIYVFSNGDFSEHKSNGENADFLYYKYYLEIEPTEQASKDKYVLEISHLLIELWNVGFKAVAACDFEEWLPRKGGYNIDYL